MSDRLSNQRPAVKPQRGGQRLSYRDNPETGVPWGQPNLPSGTAPAPLPKPTMSNTRKEIVDYLVQEGILATAEDAGVRTKAELLALLP